MGLAGDDSLAFPDIERRHLRARWLPDFDWVVEDAPSPRTALTRPLREARVGLLSTAGAHPTGSPPLGASGRAVVIDAAAEVTLTHPGYDTERAGADIDVVHPVRSLRSLAAAGDIGELAPMVCSTMGGTLIGSRVVDRGVPTAVAWARDQHLDLALLVPA